MGTSAYKTECATNIPPWIPTINANVKWIQNGITVAGGNGWGNELNQLARPLCFYVDDNDQTVYVSDHYNHRLVEWKSGSVNGRVVAGGNGQGNQNDQLNGPMKVIIDRETDSFIICDFHNKRVVRWPRQNGRSGETIISNIACSSAIMDNNGYLYVADYQKHQVERWRIGDSSGKTVVSENGDDKCLDQLLDPLYIFVDQDHSVYVSDRCNHRVLKWPKDAKEGIIVAGGQGNGNGLAQLSCPHGIIVDQLGTVYIADYNNNRVMRWPKGVKQGSVVVGGNRSGEEADQLDYPCDLSFDRENNLYVLNYGNQRVQKFQIDSD